MTAKSVGRRATALGVLVGLLPPLVVGMLEIWLTDERGYGGVLSAPCLLLAGVVSYRFSVRRRATISEADRAAGRCLMIVVGATMVWFYFYNPFFLMVYLIGWLPVAVPIAGLLRWVFVARVARGSLRNEG